MRMYCQHPPEITPYVISLIPKCMMFADIGCGYGLIGYLLRISSLFRNEKIVLIGVDINKKYLLDLNKLKVYDHLILATASHLPFISKSVDVSIAIDVIEHLTKKMAYNMLHEMDRITKKRIILTTPNGFHQVFYASNIYEVHRSGWSASELKKHGYKLHGIGIKLWWKRKNRIIRLLHIILTPLSFFIPEISAFIVACKDLSS